MPNKFITNGFSTVLPAGWLDRSLISLVKPSPSSDFATNVVVLRDEVAPELSVEDYAREQLAAIEPQLESFELLDERPAVIQGKPAYQTLQRFMSNGRLLQQAQTYVLSGNTIFAFTCTSLVEDFNQTIPDLREIMDNLSFETES